MPPEATRLDGAPVTLASCPSCGATPLRPFMRGHVQRTPLEAPIAWLRAWWRGEPFHYCAVICSECQNIVGHES